mgnify:CR=1 FL=1
MILLVSVENFNYFILKNLCFSLHYSFNHFELINRFGYCWLLIHSICWSNVETINIIIILFTIIIGSTLVAVSKESYCLGIVFIEQNFHWMIFNIQFWQHHSIIFFFNIWSAVDFLSIHIHNRKKQNIFCCSRIKLRAQK